MQIYRLLGVSLLLLCSSAFLSADGARVRPIDPYTQVMLNRSLLIARRLRTDLNLTKSQTAGILSNLAAESWLDPNAHELHLPWTQGGIGLAQWSGLRRREYVEFARKERLPTSSLDANIRFLEHELETTQHHYLLAVRDAPNDPVAVARAFIGYENQSWWFRKLHSWDHERYARLIAAHLDIEGGL